MRNLLTYPDPILKKKSELIDIVDLRAVDSATGKLNYQSIVENMQHVIYLHGGAGLAAVQIGLPKRLFLCDVGFDLGCEVYINPEIVDVHGDLEEMEEGCLSLPGLFEKVKRYPDVTVRAWDLNGSEFVRNTMNSPGSREKQKLRSQVIQHEIEHFDGVLMLDHLSNKEREKAKTILKRAK